MADRLLNADNAKIDPRKLRDYALNTNHPAGRFKAAFFGQMGYAAEQWRVLERDIREQHLSQPALPGQTSEFGTKFTITAPLRAPSGEVRWVTTVWIVRPNSQVAELVTIEPASRRRE